MTTTLTQRYIDATVSSLPPDLQSDVRDELEGSIADAVAARTDQGEDPDGAEKAVLTELGDPAILAAGYADRPLHLLGPRYFLTWWRLLKLLLWIVPACALFGVGLAQALMGADVGTIIGEAIATSLSATVHLVFWTTLVFVVLERAGSETCSEWSLDQLPEARETGAGRSDLIASLVFAALLLGALAWDQLRGYVHVDGQGLAILNPDLWPWAMLGLIALILLEAALAVAVYAQGRWSTALAVVNTALSVLFMSWSLTLIGNDLLLNPAFMDHVLSDPGTDEELPRVLATAMTAGIIIISVWDIVDGWRKASRDRVR
ncbi:permease prefix domain 1-containing protein [Brachybacterium sp. YJGR34]|uniref:permease prefix domain 1-containing protein n=1 Tax=Brachybacterium sp. YJGR34 TaxID=2059911 RepID=UPI000E0A754D|nr:permease prefix domain 1-containing protein [Brachybacterium sp. YJGR34]